MFSGDGRRLFQRTIRLFRQPQATERQGDALTAALALDVDEFERTATEVTRDAVWIMETADHAIGGIKRFLFA
ncbi:hypothetical protein D3C72_2444350 [compost metagenome]